MSHEALIHRSDSVLAPVATKNGAVHRLARSESHTATTLATHQPLTILNLLHCLRRCWKQAVTWGLILGALMAAAIWVLLPPARPSAFAKVYFPTNPNRTLFEHPDAPLNPQTQKELLLSTKILKKVVERPEVAELPGISAHPNPVSMLMRELIIDFPTGSEIMRVSMHGDRPEELRILVDATIEVYLDHISNDASHHRQTRVERLEEGLKKAKEEYERVRVEVELKGGSLGTSDPGAIGAIRSRMEEQITSKTTEMNNLRKRLPRLRSDAKEAENRLNQPVDPQDPAIVAILANDPEAADLIREKRTIEKQRDRDLPFLSPDHPDRKRYQTLLTRVDGELKKRMEELRPLFDTKLREKQRQDLEKVKTEVTTAETSEKTLQEEIQQLNNKIEKMAKDGQFVDGTKTNLRDKFDQVGRYQNALEKLKFEQDAPYRGQVLESAALMIPNETSRRIRTAGIGMFLIFGLVLMGFAFKEYRAHRIGSPDEVTNHLGVPLVGTLPVAPERKLAVGATGEQELRWEDLLNDSVDSTRALFLHTVDTQGIRIIMITSAAENEGKTTLSVRLANSLARSGRKVALIDGDLRSPQIHSGYHLGQVPGVCEYLRNEAGIAEIIKATENPNLVVIPAGKCDGQAIRQLSMNGFARLLEEVRPQVEFILVDSSPILPIADALLMARHVDGVLMSLLCDVSRIEPANMACRRLDGVGARLIGAVVNGTNDGRYYESKYQSTEAN